MVLCKFPTVVIGKILCNGASRIAIDAGDPRLFQLIPEKNICPSRAFMPPKREGKAGSCSDGCSMLKTDSPYESQLALLHVFRLL